MAILPILTVPNKKLREISKPVATVTDDHRKLMDDMLETMYDAPGIGLAAIQVGVAERIIVMDIAGQDEEPKPMYFVNPEIIEESEDEAGYDEGCLSVPGQYEEVYRPATCKMRWLDYNGAPQEEVFEDLMATCIQHEMDHLEGVLFIDHLSTMKRNMVLRKLKKEMRNKKSAA